MLLRFMVARALCLVLAIQYLDEFRCCVDVIEVDDERRKKGSIAGFIALSSKRKLLGGEGA
jgi:hypothetical protein